MYFCPPQNKKYFGGGNFGGVLGGSTKYSPKRLTFCGNMYHFRVFYLESASPELKDSSIIMKIGFKFAKIEYFQNIQRSVQNISFFLKSGSLKSCGISVQTSRAACRCLRVPAASRWLVSFIATKGTRRG